MKPFLLEIHAKEKVDVPEDWHVYRMEADNKEHPNCLVLTGKCAPIAKFSDGREQVAWALGDEQTTQTVVIPHPEHRAWVREWERKTGTCSECLGSGDVCKRWSIHTGEERMTCRACGGTGKSKEDGQ